MSWRWVGEQVYEDEGRQSQECSGKAGCPILRGRPGPAWGRGFRGNFPEEVILEWARQGGQAVPGRRTWVSKCTEVRNGT